MATISKRAGWAAALGVLVVAAVVQLLVWTQAERRYVELDIDEATYLATSLEASDLARDGDPGAVTALMDAPSNPAPLLGTVAVPVGIVFGRSLTASFVAQALFLAVLIVATYVLARSFVSPPWALLAAAAVAWSPGVVAFSRSYQFALPAAATFTAATAALVRARGFTVRRWSIGWGVCTALALLARTMMLSLVPGLLLAAVAAYWAGPRGRAPRRNLLLGGGAFLVLAAPWWLVNVRPVLRYLTGAGYGAESSTYTDGAGRLHVVLNLITRTGPFAPLLLAAVVLLVFSCVGARGQSLRRWVREALDGGLGLLAITATWTIVVLSSSSNNGSAFDLPIVATLVTAGVVALSRIPSRGWRLAAAAVVVVLLAVAGLQSLAPGSGNIDEYRADAGYPQGADLRGVLRSVADEAKAHPDQVLGVTTGDRFFNTNTIRLAARVYDRTEVLPRSVRVADDVDHVDRLLVVEPGPLLPGPAVDTEGILAAVEAQGFTQAGTLELPDGRVVADWRRPD